MKQEHSSRSVTRISAVALGLTLFSIAAALVGDLIAQTPIDARRYSFYSPELQLLAETNVTAGTPTISHEYIWFAGEPIAQVDVATQEIKWTTNDHLGTPLLQTNAGGEIVWRAEREPHGKVWSIRAGRDQHQPLGLPGQEEEQLGAYSIPGSDRMYNVFRWYRSEWGRYTQPDPYELDPQFSRVLAPATDRHEQRLGSTSTYIYGSGNPIYFTDPLGLFAVANCGCKPVLGSGNPGLGQGSGQQIFYNIPPNCQVYGRQNPVPGTGRPGVTDTDFLIGADFKRYKIPGNDWFPVIYLYSDCRGGWYYSIEPPTDNTGCCGCDNR